ncbi:hypothetical protein JW933_11705 [candidate division FCPU426 bacterium]|nr:hypothetical protein [candidate division FCPU426 bacterium]
MNNKSIWCLCIVFCLAGGSVPAQAIDRGPIIANNILGGAGAGAIVGLAAGTLAYGLDNNYNPDLLVNGAVYGFISGVLLGTGVGVYEIVTERNDTGFTLAEYTIGGTGLGALIGVVVAIIPYMRDENPEDFTIGLGLGGVVGATFGLGFAVLDISARSTSGGDMLLSGEIGVYPDAEGLKKYAAESRREPIFCCRMVRFEF